ncbi:MAG TPA: methyltransferase domain-containing protein [Candidatus Sulfotelmatobacter sp.]|nr:methyltransferase domain-containing protein [Candidatus Sulfotelmatobacter sp.]
MSAAGWPWLHNVRSMVKPTIPSRAGSTIGSEAGHNSIYSDGSMNPVQPSSREWNSAVYHRLSGPQVSWGRRVLQRLQLRGDEVVLDAGCGTGRLTADLLQALPDGRVVGIDLSQNMLNSAREHLAQFGARVSLVACDLLHLPFKRVFDGIVSTAAFHWVLDHDRLFANLRGVLKPGGWLEAQCGGGPNLVRLRSRADALAATPEFASYFAGFHEPWLYQDAEAAAATLRRAGFAGVETSVEAAPTVLDDAAHYNEFVRNIILRRHLENLPTEQARSEFMASMTEQAAKDDPPFLLDYWRLNLRGRAS